VPTYTYDCKRCGVFDYHQSIHEDPLQKCTKCGSEVKKVFSVVGIKFNGSGFYSTDSKGK
jgi:putative FmdB family regulatory protein